MVHLLQQSRLRGQAALGLFEKAGVVQRDRRLIREGREQVNVLIAEMAHGLAFPVLHDPDERVRQTYEAFAVPRVVIVDRAGRIAGIIRGYQGETTPILLLASDVGLYEIGLDPDDTFVQILVTPQQTRGFYAVAVTLDALGARNVAVAAQAGGGVWLSSEGGAPQTFRDTKALTNEDIRELAIQRDDTRAWLWAGAAAAGSDDPGKGAWRWELRGNEDPAEGWVPFGKGWAAGSCPWRRIRPRHSRSR